MLVLAGELVPAAVPDEPATVVPGVVPVPVAGPEDVPVDPVAAAPAGSVPVLAVPEDAVPDAVPVEVVPVAEDRPASAVFPEDDSPFAAVPLEVELALPVAPVLLDAAASDGLSDDCFWSLVSALCLLSAGCAFP
ncbi:MAG: hypothetical protein PHQ05_08575 [Sterolibacterium sp.]|nr:hypothetical protein [Sterolibacterium sp.]